MVDLSYKLSDIKVGHCVYNALVNHVLYAGDSMLIVLWFSALHGRFATYMYEGYASAYEMIEKYQDIIVCIFI